MLKSLLLASTLLVGSLSASLSAPVPVARHAPTAAIVSVCISKSSVAYHSSNRCAGLNRCTHEVQRMSVGAAQESGKRACRKCY